MIGEPPAPCIRFDVPLVIGVSVLLWLLVLDGSSSRLEGGVLFGLLVAYFAISIRSGRKGSSSVAKEYREAIEPPASGRSRLARHVVAGLLSRRAGCEPAVRGWLRSRPR